MGRFRMKNISQREGRTYFRRKVGGRDTFVRLPDPSDPAFAAEYARLATPDIEPLEPGHGTLGALARLFRASLPNRRTKRGPLSPKTIKNWTRYADMIDREHGHRLVRQIRPAHVYAMQARLAETPGVANNYVAVLQQMMQLACRLDWHETNPAAGIRALPLGEHTPWPARVIEAALAVAAPMPRLAITAALCSGQRIGDLIRMQHGWHDRRILQLTQGKTGKRVAIPMHGLWLDELDRVPRRAVTLLYDRTGRPFQSEKTLRERVAAVLGHARVRAAIAEAVAAEECPEGATFSLHGLRKNACCYLLELGLTDEDVGALLGMAPDTVRHYGKARAVYRIAERVAQRVLSGDVVSFQGGTRRGNAAKTAKVKPQ